MYVEKQRHHSANKSRYSQGCGLPSGHIWLWELNRKESRAPKNRCLQTVVSEKTTESPLDSKEINQSILREINPEYSLKGLMLKLKLQYSGHQMGIADSLEKSLMLEKIGARRRRGHQRMRWLAGWHHQCNGCELGLIWGDGEGQRGLVCCSPWGLKIVRYNWVTE